jgi:hypothetical protein
MKKISDIVNSTNFEHVGYSLLFASVLAAVLWLITGDLKTSIAVGCGFGAGFFVGREHDQAEDRWVKKFGEGKSSNMPWWGGLDLRVWDEIDPWMDWVLPAIVMSVVFWLSQTYL